MPSEQSRREFEAAFDYFSKQYSLAPVWYSDKLMCWEPLTGSKSAKLCVDFAPGFWPLYEASDVDTQGHATASVAGLTAQYHVNWMGRDAQDIKAKLSAIDPSRKD